MSIFGINIVSFIVGFVVGYLFRGGFFSGLMGRGQGG